MHVGEVRERALDGGVRSLRDAELLSILLPPRYAIAHAEKILAERPLPQLIGETIHGLAVHVPERSALAVAAVLELTCRLTREQAFGLAVHRPDRAARYLTQRYLSRTQEVMGALYVDARSRIVAEAEHFRGVASRAAVCPSVVLRAALARGTPSFLVFHTHPSGDPTPSAEDLAFTRRLAEGASLVGLHLCDHLIIGGPERWVSLRSEGAW